MPYTTYRVTYKSQEERGASQPNIIELAFNSDADAVLFGANGEEFLNALNVSVDKLLSSNYSRPYPAGTNSMSRTGVTDGAGDWNQIRVYDTPSGFAPVTRAAALITAGFQGYKQDRVSFFTPTAVNVTVFTPGNSV